MFSDFQSFLARVKPQSWAWIDLLGLQSWGTSGQVLTSNGADKTPSFQTVTNITILTEQATTSGTTKDFTIPSGAKRVKVMLVGVSTNGTSNYLVQLGDAGGVEATGYTSNAELVTSGGTPATATSTAGFIFTAGLTGAGVAVRGTITLDLEDASDFTWTASGTPSSGDGVYVCGGSKSLSAELTTVRVTTVTPNTFDAGVVNVSWE